ncbi:unnamed protein product, partial [Oppiella nova]
MGSNIWGSLGLGDNTPQNSPQIIPQLCHKNVKQFFIGSDFVLAITEDNRTYGWGYNEWGQVGRYPCKEFLVPQEIAILSDQDVCQISCGFFHAMALTGDGRVYGWGCNQNGQVGTGGPRFEVREPTQLGFNGGNSEGNIKSIFCYLYSSYAITRDGKAYSWGANSFYNLGHNSAVDIAIPTLIVDIVGVHRVCSGGAYTYFLTNDGCIHFSGQCGNQQDGYSYVKSPIVLFNDQKYQDIFGVFSRLANGFLVIVLGGDRLLQVDKDLDVCLKELDTMVKVRSEYCVRYLGQWHESDDYYIRMELCADSLQNILELKPQLFCRESEEAMNSVEYFISCEIFKEVLTCIQSLHNFQPPITHRDLKPDNILLAKNVQNVSDFGLATIHEHTSEKGLPKYCAPEIAGNQGYSHKVDIYSLSRIAELDIFCIDLEQLSSDMYTSDCEVVNECMTELVKLLLSMQSDDPDHRPECALVLNAPTDWAIDIGTVEKDPEYDKNVAYF